MSNPLLEPWPEHGLPDFARIEPQHYTGAIEEAMAIHRDEIRAIVDQSDAPDFRNTVEAMERSGQLFKRVLGVFHNQTSARSTDALQQVELDLMPKVAAHESAIFTNGALYARVRAAAEANEALSQEQARLLEELVRAFERSGAGLPENERTEVSRIDARLAGLYAQFGQNVLRDTNDSAVLLTSESEIAGLPQFVLRAARAEAAAKGYAKGYLFTTSRSSITPFLQYARRRDLREQLYVAYTAMGGVRPERDNRELIREIVTLRQRRAHLLGFANHAEYALDNRMAGTPAAVKGLLDRVWEPAAVRVAEEAEDLQRLAQREGENFEIMPWDWWYYTEKLRAERFDLDEESLKPYFELGNVRDGAFEVAQRLYGIRFERTHEVPVYHPDVESYRVRDADGSLIGLFLADYRMRADKRGGAWMSCYRTQSNLDEPAYPVVVNCCNFPQGEPCLLGLDEVRTLFHEFGHGLHGLLSKVAYESLASPNVKQDFVELPSQIMEHWAIEPAVLKRFARHFETGEPIPDDLIEKIHAAKTFNQGFATTEYLAASYLDIAWHTRPLDAAVDVDAFERDALEEIGLTKTVDPRYKSTYFQHIFSGDSYSSGYYSYLWAEVLDADGYEAFREKGIFDPATARAFREYVLERGNTAPPMDLYRAFRGRDPEVEPLLRERGLGGKA